MEVNVIINAIQDKLLEVDPADVYRFGSLVSGGLQEYIEAVGFYHFLKYGTLVTKSFIEEFIQRSHPQQVKFELPMTDYLLGICDTSGELMRFAVNTVSKGDRESAFVICDFLRDLFVGFRSLNFRHKDYGVKLDTMEASLLKVEKVCYQIRIRGAEYPDQMLAELFSDDFSDNVDSGRTDAED
eukprot:TRINITY_DN2226_c0_g1_i2.p1 TRINITY_DN2226_c0_g1~~TRINITY_DN2226_c0_g1_i2.p1  ORF type:complete len:184 (-),score=50.84 TRINITY_DN2226_c0_g1_i2:47-598(-)